MFREDLKSLYTLIGAENKKVMFLFTDSHVADEGQGLTLVHISAQPESFTSLTD